MNSGQPAGVATRTNAPCAVIYYKDLSFRNPLLKKVIWTAAPQIGN